MSYKDIPYTIVFGFAAGVAFTLLFLWLSGHSAVKEKEADKPVSAEIEVRNFADTGLTCYCRPCRCVEGVPDAEEE